MTLSQIVKQFRTERGLSQRQFSAMCNMSTGYVSMLEEGVNPRTKEPLVPSLVTMRKIAIAMGMSLDELMSMVDGDALVSLNGKDAPAQQDERTSDFIRLFGSLDPERQETLLHVLRGLLAEQKSSRGSRD